MDILDAIYGRRATRDFRDRTVGRPLIDEIVDAAIHAPSAMNLQPWSFAVIEGREFLSRLSARAKRHFLDTLAPDSPAALYRAQLESADFNIFYDAPCLVLVCATNPSQQAKEDCCLAAENLMLAAYGRGLGTCWIGFARPWLELETTRRELGLPDGAIPVAPIIVGYPQSHPEITDRHRPAITWCAP